ncbi:MAG: threonine/serine dehydratase [Candidatus Micrarchaeota archaeon]|nr:threonine/serine dehydratase [Candidatus Micrarchaeota archaeon]
MEFKEVLNSRLSIKKYISETPLIELEHVNKIMGCQVYFKLENMQISNAFKVRGPINKLQNVKSNLIVAASSGNHGIGISYASMILGKKALIVVPVSTPKKKLDKMKENGAEVILYGKDYQESFEHATSLSHEGYVLIPSFNDEDIIAGNGSITLEILDKIPDIDGIIAPIGGGGLISSIGFVAKSINPEIEVIGVQSDGADSMKLSLEKQELYKKSKIETIADGIAVREPGDICFDFVKKYVDDIVLVSDDEIKYAMRFYAEVLRLIVEPAGAASLAAALKMKKRLKGRKIACIVTGGNVDIENWLKYCKYDSF